MSSTKPDRRPELSSKLKRLSEGPQVFEWPNRGRLLLEPPREYAPLYPLPILAIIVHRGRFGLAHVVHNDGLRALDVEWLTGGPKTAQVYLRRHQVRALVTDAPTLVAGADLATLVGKPVYDGEGGPVIGRIVSAGMDGDQIRARAEVSRGCHPTHIKPTLLTNSLVLMLAMASLGVDDNGEPR